MTSYIHVVFSVCLQLVEDVKAVDGHQPHRRLRKKVHHRLLLRPNQPGRLSRSEARYKHGIVCDFIISFSWNNHDVFTKFSILFRVLYVFRLFFWLLSTWVTKKTFTIFAKNKGEWKKKNSFSSRKLFSPPVRLKMKFFWAFFLCNNACSFRFFCLLLYYYYN